MRKLIIDHFFKKKKKEKIIIIQHKKDNILYDWIKIRSPVTIVLNYLIINLGSILPLYWKIWLYRNILCMKIGKRVAIAPEASFDSFYPNLIRIGNNVIIGQRAFIFTHEYTHKHIRFARVNIKSNAVIGAFCVIRSGVTIGKNSIVAMNSYVNKNIPDNEVWGGVPAKFLRNNVPKNKNKKELSIA